MGGDKWKLENLNVEPEYRRKGIATKLIEHISKDLDIPYNKLEWGKQTKEGALLKEVLDKKATPTAPVAEKAITKPEKVTEALAPSKTYVPNKELTSLQRIEGNKLMGQIHKIANEKGLTKTEI